ncbi:MAG TPA: DUF1559 domain-containing protein [Gemmatales bacterium]|nr:DUF1559 domain-containing protein [Gemmatales bacterium]
MSRRPSLSRKAFTLVELMVVLAIILLLLALLLPAVQRVREAANKVVCASRLRTIGQAVQLYLASNNQLFPSGGGDNPLPRTLNAVGLPTTRMDQDWGWLYQILPYLEQDNLWKYRSTNSPVASYVSAYGYDPAGDAEIVATPIETYFCPSRRGPQVLMADVGKRAMNDYAGNIGSFTMYDANGLYHPSCANATGWEEGKPKNPYRNGVFVKSRYFKSQLSNSTDSAIHVRDISDGMANTILAADKRMNSALYNQAQFGDTDGFTSGYIADTLRSGFFSPSRDFSVDYPTPSDTIERFGSAHPYGINAVFCDGSVRTISYNIPDNRKVCQVYNGYLSQRGIYPLPDGPPGPTVPYAGPYPPYCMELTLFQRLCHRSDGSTTDLRLLDD